MAIFGSPFLLWSQNIDQDADTYVIRNVEYNIDGKTRKSVLAHTLGIEQGESFVGRTALELYLADKLQIIQNQRTLADGAIKSSYEPDPQADDRVFVDLQVSVRDTWNFIALPYAKYDSNEGLLLSLRGRNYNFLGGMEPLEINLDYTKSEVGENEVSVNGEFAVPFYWLGYEWMADFKEDVTLSSEQPTSVTSKAELAVDIPTDFHTWQASVEQAYYLNKDGDEDPDQWYLASSGRFGSSIPLGFELPGFTEVNYNPAVITSAAYKPGYSLSEDRRGFALGAEHGITTGRIDWKGNFRDGAELEFTQDARWNFARERWLSELEAEMQVHKSFDFMGFSSRIQGFYSYGGVEEDAGEPIRGILDKRLEGDAGVYANFDFPFQMWIWFLDRWFDGHLGPFFDYALVSPLGQDGLDLSDGWYGVGLEAFAYPKAARSIYLRMSLGLDLEAMLEGTTPGEEAPRDGEPIYELYIGLGHHY